MKALVRPQTGNATLVRRAVAVSQLLGQQDTDGVGYWLDRYAAVEVGELRHAQRKALPPASGLPETEPPAPDNV